MSQRLSPWFDCVEQPPVRSGWYDVQMGRMYKPLRLWYWSTLNEWGVAYSSRFRTEHMRGLKWRGVLK